MAQLVYTTLLLNSKPVLTGSNFSVELHQAMTEHHELTITCPTDAIEPSLGNFADNVQKFIGQRLSLLVFKVKGAIEPSLKFMGIVTHANINKFDGADGEITIIAQSPTILLSHGQDSQSYEKQTLVQIIEAATKEYRQDLVKLKVFPKNQTPIPYTVQYKEDDFSFLQRLATRYGEWLYYDGEQICFSGVVGSGNQELLYGQNLQSFNFSMQTRPQEHTYMAYDSLRATVHQADMSQFKKDVTNPYITHTTNESAKLFAKKPKSIYNHSLLQYGKAEIDQILELKSQHALNTISFQGHSDEPGVQLAKAVGIKGIKPGYGLAGTDFYGKYIVTKIIHTINSGGEYRNQFTGVPRDIKVPPYFSENAVPICEEQYAIVKDNNDPEGLSRIRVQFPWQEPTKQLTPWIRVTTPYAGKGKGMHILPELEEEVLVSFESGCAEKPVVIGTMFHGSGKSGHGGAGNYMKGFQTASGNRLQMNDQDGSVYLADKGTANMKFDGAGNATTNANANHSVNAGSTHVVNVGANKNQPAQSVIK
ncbi:MAG: type VI secretion system Vgr family protein, partial [Moheibacter sp.]